MHSPNWPGPYKITTHLKGVNVTINIKGKQVKVYLYRIKPTTINKNTSPILVATTTAEKIEQINKGTGLYFDRIGSVKGILDVWKLVTFKEICNTPKQSIY